LSAAAGIIRGELAPSILSLCLLACRGLGVGSLGVRARPRRRELPVPGKSCRGVFTCLHALAGPLRPIIATQLVCSHAGLK